MSAKEVYNTIRLKNLKKAKIRQKEAELELAIQYNNLEEIDKIDKEIQQLQKELMKLSN
jgi:hypothetical protein